MSGVIRLSPTQPTAAASRISAGAGTGTARVGGDAVGTGGRVSASQQPSAATRVQVTEGGWLRRIQECRLCAHRLPIEAFRPSTVEFSGSRLRNSAPHHDRRLP
jgi:hypothetical protein